MKTQPFSKANTNTRHGIRVNRTFAAYHSCVFGILLASATGAFAQTETDFVRLPDLPNNATYSFGCAWGDYNGDGYVDLAVANGAFNGSEALDIYRNDGNGTFTRMATNEVGSVVGEKRPWFIVRWADMNSDGKLDLLAADGNLSVTGKDRLYLNDGQGVYNAAAGGDLSSFHTVAGWVLPADYDLDGILDLLAGHAWASMNSYGRLLHGRGDGTFSVVSTNPPALTTVNSAVWADYDSDGDPDLFVANHQARPDYVYRNEGGGNFTRITTGLLANSPQNTLHAAWGDYDNDGDLDVIISKVGTTILLRNDGTNFFNGVALPAGANGTIPLWFDYDNDSLLDLYCVRGQGSSMRNVLLHNDGGGTFTPVSNALTADWGGWTGVARGDIDNDGFMDIFVTSSDGRDALYRNLGNTNNWIKFKFVGITSNGGAIGAKVRVLATIGGKSVWQMLEISSGSYWQDDPRPNVGLGDATNVKLVRVEWPSGIAEEFTNVAPHQLVTIVEPSLRGALRADGKFHLYMTMSTNRVYQLQASADFVNWTVLTNCTGSGSCTPVECVDPEAPSAVTARFYRMK